MTLKRLRLTFAALALTLIVVPLAARAPLVDPDEGLHAAIAQEMILRHDYVTPTFLGEPFLDKPILFFWAEAVSLHLFGMNETAVRLPPLLFGLLGMLSVYVLGRRLLGEQVALVAGIVYASMLLPLGVSQVAVHDVALVPFICLGVVLLIGAAESPRPHLWSAALGVALGLSILTKGLVGVVFVGIFAFWLAMLRRELLPRIVVSLAVAGAVAMLTAAPWYLLMERAHPGYLRYYFIERHLQGYLTSTQRHSGRPWYYYAPILIGGTLPWTGYLVGAFRSLRVDQLRRTRLLIWYWLGSGLIFLSIGESKLVTYALPLFPGLAILIGDYVVRVWSDSRVRSAPRLFRAGFAVHTLALAAMPLAAATLVSSQFGVRATAGSIAAVAVIPIVIAAALAASRALTLDAFIARMTVALCAGFCVMSLLLGPFAADRLTGRDLAKFLNASGRLPVRTVVLDERIGSVVFYLSPPLRADANPDRITMTSKRKAVEAIAMDPDEALMAVRDKDYPEFSRLFAVTPQPQVRAGTFTLYRADQLREALGLPR